MDSNNGSNFTQIQDACVITEKILQTPGISILIIFGIAFCVVAVLLNFLFFVSVWKVTLFHLNLRFLFAHLCFCSIWFCAASLVKYCSILSALITGNHCSLVTNGGRCVYEDFFRAWSSQALMYACSCITIERLYCTFRYTKPYTGFPWLGILLIPLCHTTPIVNFLRRGPPPSQYIPFCESLLSLKAESARSGMAVHIIFSLFSIAMACYLQYLNQSRLSSMLVNRAKTHTLTARFQLDQNIQLTRIIAPTTILEFITFLPTLLVLMIALVHLELTYEKKTILIQCAHIWKISFALACPMVAFVRNAHLRRGLKKLIPSKIKDCINGLSISNTVEVVVIAPKGAPIKDTAAHFEMLDEAWNSVKGKKNMFS